MMDRLDNPSKVSLSLDSAHNICLNMQEMYINVVRKCFELAAELKEIMRPLYAKHQDDIITGHFSAPGLDSS